MTTSIKQQSDKHTLNIILKSAKIFFINKIAYIQDAQYGHTYILRSDYRDVAFLNNIVPKRVRNPYSKDQLNSIIIFKKLKIVVFQFNVQELFRFLNNI